MESGESGSGSGSGSVAVWLGGSGSGREGIEQTRSTVTHS